MLTSHWVRPVLHLQDTQNSQRLEWYCHQPLSLTVDNQNVVGNQIVPTGQQQAKKAAMQQQQEWYYMST